MFQKLKNMIKFGKVSSTQTNSAEVSFYDVTKKCLLYLPYGLQANPADQIMGIVINIEANEDNQVVFPLDPANRDKTLTPGELAIGIPANKTRIVFLKNGDIHFVNGTVDGGDFVTKFTEMETAFNQLKSDLNSAVSTFNAHVHPSAMGPTGPTVTPETPSTADMSQAKCSVIQIPNL